MENRFGLTFVVFDRAFMMEKRRERGYGDRDFPEREVIPIAIDGLPPNSPELELSRLLQEYRTCRERRLKDTSKWSNAQNIEKAEEIFSQNFHCKTVKQRNNTMVLTTSPRCDRVVLHNLTWQQFKTLLQTLGENQNVRVAYDFRTLEIMTPLPDHEKYKNALSLAIQDIADLLDLEYECLGSTTWKREAKLAGVEPDDCFYFQNESRIRGLSCFDLDRDPPPDLALEIDLTNKSIDRLPIYARLGVPEIWNYDIERKELTIYQLDADNYSITETSSIFPQIPVREIPQIIDRHRQDGRLATRRKVKEWVRSQVSK
jgi:Uma2 family endonuclease